MSADDIKLVEETLNGLLVPDNTLRKKAEQQLESLQANRAGLTYCLSSILLNSQSTQVKVYASVVLRKLLQIKEDQIINPVWKSIDENTKEQIKLNVLKALDSINDKSLKYKICDAAIQISENVYESEEQWADLLNYIYVSLNSPLTEEKVLQIETGLYLLSSIFGYANDELSKGIDLYITAFKNYFSSNSMSLKTRTVQAITEILCIVRKKDVKKFKDFVLNILQTILECMENPKEEANLRVSLTALADLASVEHNMIRKSYSDIFTLMGRITEKKDFSDETLRELGFEVILTMIEKNPKLISDDQAKLKILVEAIYKYALEMETDIDDSWLTPKSESYIDEEYIPEEKVASALSLVDRLSSSIGSEIMLRLLSDIVLQLLNKTDDWRYKYIGYMTISQMVENVSDITHIDNILPLIFTDIQNTNPKIRYSCLQCISQIAENLNPQFQNNYHDKVFPAVLERIRDPVLRVQLQACDSLTAYLEYCTDQIAAAHCQTTLDVIFSEFLKQEISTVLRESLLNTLAELVSATEEQIKPFAEKILQVLLEFFSISLQNKSNKPLYGILLDAVTLIGPKAEETYHKLLPNLLTAMLEIQDNIPNMRDPVTSYLHSAWERVIPIVKERYVEITPKIIESAIKLVTNMPTMSVSSEPERKFNIQELLGGLNPESNGKPEKRIQLTTSETEDLSGCLEVLNIMIETFGEHYLQYIDITQKSVFPLLTFEINDDVRAEASKALPSMIEIIKKHSTVENLHATAKVYVSQLVSALDSETDNAVIATFLDAISDVVTSAGLFLTTPEINVLFTKLLENFDKVEKSRISLLHQKEKVEDDILQEKQAGHDKIYSDDEEDDEDDVVGEIEKDIEEIEEVLVSIADTMGALFSTHKSLTLEIVNKLLNELLPKYFTEKASTFEKKMGLFILDDMIEFLGQDLLSTIWLDVGKTVIAYADNKSTELRQASLYGIGEFAKQTTKDFNLYAAEFLNALNRALEITNTEGDDTEWGHARDNAVSSLGKIIKYQHSNIDINTWIPRWLSYLPLTHDPKEAEWNHGFLTEILTSNPNLILGENNSNLTKIIKIFARIYDTKFSSEEIDKKILELFENIKKSEHLFRFVEDAKSTSDDKVLKKLKALFP